MRLTFRQTMYLNNVKAAIFRAVQSIVTDRRHGYAVDHLTGSPVSVSASNDPTAYDSGLINSSLQPYSTACQWEMLVSNYSWRERLAKKAFPLPAQWEWRHTLLQNSGFKQYSDDRYKAAVKSGIQLGITGYSDRKLFIEEKLEEEASYDLFKQVELAVELRDRATAGEQVAAAE